MGAKARARVAARTAQGGGAPTAKLPEGAEIPVVGQREPCPCGSGQRYKSCHGKAAARAAAELVRRPYEGLPGECDWVAMREIVPSATASVTLTGEHGGRTTTIATVLPMAWPALVRGDGEIQVGLQTLASSGDVSRDAAYALELALAAEPGTPIAPSALPPAGSRLQDLLDLTQPFAVTVYEGFDYWAEGDADPDGDAAAAMAAANEGIVPTVRLESVDAGYWCRIRDKAHLRWVVPHEEEAMLDALARLHAAGADTLGEGSRYIGSFRAHGLVVPVWDVDPAGDAAALEEPAAALETRLREALAVGAALTDDERRARAAVQSRQITLR
jgi:hypothetical protein